LGDAAGRAVFLTLRVAVTGTRRSPPLHPVMEVRPGWSAGSAGRWKALRLW